MKGTAKERLRLQVKKFTLHLIVRPRWLASFLDLEFIKDVITFHALCSYVGINADRAPKIRERIPLRFTTSRELSQVSRLTSSLRLPLIEASRGGRQDALLPTHHSYQTYRRVQAVTPFSGHVVGSRQMHT